MSMNTTRRGVSQTDATRAGRAREIARAAGTAGSWRRPGAAALAAGAASFAAAPSFGQVAGEQVVHGAASFQRQGTLTTITASNNAVINYNSFNIRANESVRFVQPDSLSRVLNRINSSRPTQIDGSIASNGIVYIVNPAGIYFSKGAMINVGGIYAAAGTITNQDFLRGVDKFVTAPGGRVVNEGTIQAPVIGLVGQSVANFGALNAPEGAVMMLSGDTVLIGERDGHVFAKIEAPAPAGPQRGGGVGAPAPSGRQGRFGAGDMYALAVWNSGTVKAESIRLESDRGAVVVKGTLDASNTAPGGTGGSVEVLGMGVGVQGATIDASGDTGGGQILVGGNYQGKGAERNATHTIVTSGSDLRADAKSEGDGGRVIVWSDTATRFDGHISARGGSTGGDGGFAEISSKNELASNINVDLSAPAGNHGTLLFDPAFVSIEGGSLDGSDTEGGDNASFLDQAAGPTGTIDFGDTGQDKNSDTNADGGSALDPFKIYESEIENTGANIIIRATQQIVTAGDFTGDAVVLSNGSNLTLETDGSTGAGVIDLTSSLDGAALRFETQTSGTITIRSTSVANTTDILVGRLETANQDITISTTNGQISLADTIDAGTGTVRLSASSLITQGAGAVITAGSIGAAAASGITLDGASNDTSLFAASLSGAGTIAFRNAGDFSVGTVADVVGTTDVAGVTTPGGTVKLRSNTGFINQNASSPIVADTLGVGTDGALSLNLATNDVNTVALSLTGGSGSITYVDADGFTVGTVTGVGGSTVTGIDAGARDIALTIGAGSTANQTSPISGSKLTLAGAGTFDFTGATNAVSTLQAGTASTSAGGVSLIDADGVQILDESDVTGNLAVRSLTGTITPNGTIGVGGDLTLTADDIDLSAGGLTFSPGASSVATLQPITDSTAVHVVDGNAGFHITQPQLGTLSAFPSLVIGSDTGTALLTFGGTTAFAQHITLRSGGQGGSVTLLNGSSLATTTTKNITIKAGSNDAGNTVHGIFTQTGTAAINAGAGALSITGDEMAFGAADSIEGTGALALQPATAGRALQIGGTDDAAKFSIDTAEFLALKDGFSKIVIGRNDSNAASTIDTLTANDPLIVQTPLGGTMDVLALSANSGVALVTGGTLNVNQAFSATNAEITLKSGAGLTIANNIDAGTGTVRLVAGGDIVQSPGVQITAGALGVRGTGEIDLRESGNNVGTFAALTNGATDFVIYRDSNAFTVGTVGAETLNNGVPYFTSTSGITTSAGDVTLAGGAVDITGGIAAVGGAVRIASTGAVTQTAGRIFASELGVTSQGPISIVQAATLGNQIANVALDASGAAGAAAVSYVSGDPASGVQVSEVTAGGAGLFAGATGITSSTNGDVLVSTVGGITIRRPINAGSGAVRLSTGGSVFQSNAGADDGRVLAGALGLRAGANSVLQLANTPTTLAADTGTGDLYYNLTAGNLLVGQVGASGTFTSVSGVTAGDVRLAVPGSVSQTFPIVADALAVRSDDSVTLTNASNDVGTLAVNIVNAAQSTSFRDSNALTVGSVAALGAVFPQTDGIITAGDVSVASGAGLLQIDETIDVGGSRDVRLVSGQGIAQTLTAGKGIIADALGVNAGADAKLLNADNDVATFSGRTTAGDLKYVDKSAIEIDTLSADAGVGFINTVGLSTAGGDALIDAVDAVLIKNGTGTDVNVGAGTLRIVSGGSITQEASSAITAGAVGFVAAGTVDLSQVSNAIGVTAGTSSAVSAPVRVTTTGPLTVSNIGFDADSANFPSVGGVTSTDGAITLVSTGALSINEIIDSGLGGVLLSAGGLVTLDSAVRANAGTGIIRITTTGGVTQTSGDLIASSLGVRAGGAIRLDSISGLSVPLNNIGTFAANAGAAGNITLLDVGGFTVGTVAASGPFTATSGITTTGTTRLLATGAGGVLQTSPISSLALGVISDGPATLTNASNDFDTVAVRGTTVGVNTLGTLNVGTVTALGNFPGVSGVTVTGGGPGATTIASAGNLTLGSNVDVGAGTLVLDSGGLVDQTAGSIIAGELGVDAQNGVSLDSTTNDVGVFAARTNSGAIQMIDADGLVIGTVSAAGFSGAAATGAVSLQAGASGTGDLTFGTGVTVRGASVTLRAGDGPGGAGTTARVDARTNSPTFSNVGLTAGPGSFTFQQDADIDTNTASLPLVAQYTNSLVSTTYRLQSDDGDILADATSLLFQPTTDLTLAVTPNAGRTVQIAPGLIVNSLTIIGASTVQSVTSADTIEFQNDVTFDSTDTFLEGDEINFGGDVFAANPGQTLTLRPRTLNRTINVGAGGTDLNPVTGELDLTALEISRIQRAFAKVIIGEDPLVFPVSPLAPFQPLTGLLRVVGPVTFVNPTTLGMRGTGSRIEINAPVRMSGITGSPAPLLITGTGATTLLANDIITNGQAINIQDSLLITGSRALDTTDNGAVPAGAAVTVTGLIDGYVPDSGTADALTIRAGLNGAVALNSAVGAATLADGRALDGVDITGGTIALPAVTTTGLQVYNGTTTLNGNLTSTFNDFISFDGPTILASPTLVIRTAGGAGDNIVFDGIVDGASDLTLDVGASGQVQFNNNVGGTTALTRLAVLGGSQIAAPLTLRTGTATGNTVSLNGPVTGAGNALTITSGGFTLGGNVTLGSLAVNAPTLLSVDPIGITTTALQGVVFNGTVDSVSILTGLGAPDLTVNTGSGAAAFGAAVGATTPLGSLTVNGATVSLQSVRTVGAQAYTAPAVTLNGNLTSLTSGTIAVTGGWTLGSAVTVQSAGGASDAITFTGASQAGSAGRSLTVNAGSGVATFNGDVGATGTELASLAVTGSTVSVGNVSTTGGQTYTGSTTAGGTLTGGSVTATGPTISLNTVSTTGAQSYTGATTLNGNLSASGPSPITVNGATTLVGAARSITTGGGTISLQNVDGAAALSTNAGAGQVVFGASSSVGSLTPLLSLTATGAQVSTGLGVTTTGAQAYNGATSFGGNVTVTGTGAVTVNGPLNLVSQPVTVRTAGGSSTDSIAINGTVNGGPALVLNAGPQGNVVVTGAVGDTIDPASLSVTGRTITLKSAETTGDQAYFGTTTLTDGATASRLFFYGDAVLGNAAAESTFTGTQGARFIGNTWLFGDSVINGGNGQIYFHGRVETAQVATAGVAAATNRALTLISTHSPDMQTSGTDPHTDPNFTAWVDAPFLFNANVGGDYGSPSVDPSTNGAILPMLRSITFSRAGSTGVTPVSTIVQTKGHFTFPQANGEQDTVGTPDPDINKWFLGSNTALRLGGFTIPAGFDFNPALASATTRMNTTAAFDMGAGNKFLSVGNLFAYVDAGNATLGDLTSIANINVLIGEVERSPVGSPTTRSIFINPRGPGGVTSNQFKSDTPPVGFVSTNDAGVDFVSLNNINFSVDPTLAATGTARFSTPAAANRATFTVRQVDFFGSATEKNGLQRSEFKNANVDRKLLFPADGNAGVEGTVFPNLSAFGLGIDLQAEGAPKGGGVAGALAGAIPTARTAEVRGGVSLGSSVLDELAELGLNVKKPKDGDVFTSDYLAERSEYLSGRSDYNDVPAYAKPAPDRNDYLVSINRLSADSVATVLAAYHELVGEDRTGRAERKLEIQNSIAVSFEKFTEPMDDDDAGRTDGVAFRRFVEASDSESEKTTLGHLDRIANLLRKIDGLALTEIERRGPKQRTLGDLCGDNMSAEMLEEAALGVPVLRPDTEVAGIIALKGTVR